MITDRPYRHGAARRDRRRRAPRPGGPAVRPGRGRRVHHRGSRAAARRSGLTVRLADARRRRRRRRPERTGGGDRARAGRPFGAGARGRRHGRRRDADGRADAAGLPPRRLLGDPPGGGRLAVPALAAARGARPGVDPSTGAARPSVRRRNGGCARELRRGDRRRPRRGRSSVPAPVRAPRRGRRRSDRPAARAAPSPAAPARGDAVRGERASSRDHARQAAVRRRACAGALRRARRALDPPALEAAQRRGRARPGPLRARLRVAAAPRRLAGDRRCPRLVPAFARRRDPLRLPG